ncbi:MAG: nuclear transport factor 2 family protein [Cyclobacteriaceae bacterium]
MTTEEIANRLVALCREGKYQQVYDELFSPDVLSIEPEESGYGTTRGMAEMAEKSKKWNDMVAEFHSGEISDPIVAENFFSLTMKSRITMKGMDHPINMDEVCVYQVNDGKVVCEQFFYTPMPQPV